MRFSAPQHRVGILRWDPRDVVIELVDVSGSQVVDGDGQISNNQVYSFLKNPLGPDRSIELRGLRNWVPDRPICWLEVLQPNGLVVTDLWDFDGKSLRLIRLAHVPDYGIYHRLVVDSGKLEWNSDLVIREGHDTIRMIEDVYGPWSQGINFEEGDQKNYKWTMGIVEGPLNGKFVEVVARGKNASDARIRAFAILGYINLILGPGAYGAVRIDAAIDATRCRRQRYLLYADSLLGFRVEVNDFPLDVGLSDLAKLSDKSSKSRASIALERYGQAATATSEELSFAALVSGIDAVVSDFYGEREGGALAKKRAEDAESFVNTKLIEVAEDMKRRIREMLVSPSLLDKFSFYVREQNLDANLIAMFKTIRGPRNELFHRASAEKVHVSLGSAKKIMEQLICHEAGIDPKKVWRFERGQSTAGEVLLSGFGWDES